MSKRYVSSFVLNAVTLSMFFTLSGSLFHTDGPLIPNDGDAKVCCLVFGTSRLPVALHDPSPSLHIGFTYCILQVFWSISLNERYYLTQQLGVSVQEPDLVDVGWQTDLKHTDKLLLHFNDWKGLTLDDICGQTVTDMMHLLDKYQKFKKRTRKRGSLKG